MKKTAAKSATTSELTSFQPSAQQMYEVYIGQIKRYLRDIVSTGNKFRQEYCDDLLHRPNMAHIENKTLHLVKSTHGILTFQPVLDAWEDEKTFDPLAWTASFCDEIITGLLNGNNNRQSTCPMTNLAHKWQWESKATWAKHLLNLKKEVEKYDELRKKEIAAETVA